jgi:hypothetical protein
MGGWTSSALIELADKRTERRGSKTLDLESEFLMALQEFCMETRWEWRRKFVQFDLQAGVWEYNLAGAAPLPCITDLHQMVKHGVKYYPNAGTPQNWCEITPLFEKALQAGAIYTNTNFPQPAPPQQYFRMPGVALTMAVVPVPDQPYPITLDYWSVPNLTSDEVPETIPLVPPYLHHVLLKKLEAEIFRYTLGEGSTKFQAAISRYEALVQKYQIFDAMVPGEQKDYSADDECDTYWSTGHNAIQSTT